MRSKFNLALFIIGLPPLVGLVGFFLWMSLTQAPVVPKAAPVNMATVNATLPMLQRNLSSISSSLFQAIKKTSDDIPTLAAHNDDTSLDNFVKSHPGVTGLSLISMTGKVEKTFPATAILADANYSSSDEFQNILTHFKDKGNVTYEFYTQRLGYPAFLFTIPVSTQDFVESAFNLGSFFRDLDAKGGDFFILDANTGQYLYHSNPAKLSTPFNPSQEPWLVKVQNDLKNKQDGSSLNGNISGAVYSSLGIGQFGVVHVFPLSALQPAAEPGASAKPFPDNVMDLAQSPAGFTALIALLVALAWVFIVGSLCYGMILSPLRKAGATVLNAAQGSGTLSADTARAFGKDEIGQMVQAVSMLTQKLGEEKQQVAQEKEEAMRRGRAEVESKTKEAATQVSAAQHQAQSVKNELNDKNQQLNDKLKELDAMKGMSEGLRSQNEQAKAENAKLKSQISEITESQGDFQKKIADTQTQLKDMESKMLQAVSAASAIQVSQVRAAAIRTMAEELKTTLGIIKGYVSSALGTTQGGISEKQQEFLGMVINRSARLEKFINDLVDIYQVEIEQVDAKKEEVNLASEIEGLAFNFQAQAEVKNIKMKVEAKGTVPPVPIVRRRFNQLWNILYLQIIKDAPRGSSVPITVEAIGDNVKITVQDPGLVVAPESLPKMFDEFYDPKHPASPQLAGTGLKFALVKTILAAHGGGAVAEKADPGTKLLLTFSTKAKKAAAPVAAPSAGPSIAPSPSPLMPPKSPGLMPAAGIGAPKPAGPGITPSIGIPKPAAPSIGIPKPATPGVPGQAPAAAGPVGMPKPPATPVAPAASGGVLDALISGKVPPVGAPGLKPPAAPGVPPSPGLGVPPAPKPAPPLPTPAAPGAPPIAPKPSAGLLDALLDKKPPSPGAPPAAPAPGLGIAPPPRPPMPSTPGTIPPSPSLGAPGIPVAPKPPVPGIPSAPAAPRPPMPTPGMVPPPPPMGAPPAAPKVVPTNLKPTAPPPGILDLDNADSFKVDAGPKPPAPSAPPMGAPRPPMPGAPAPPAGAPRPSIPPPGIPGSGLKPPIPPPGVPPGGLNPSNAVKKDGDGELIE